MEKIELFDVGKLTAPCPVTLICTLKPDGSTNLATVSWWTILSLAPKTIGFATMKQGYTGQRVRETKEVVLTVPGEELQRAVMGCGSTSGADVDKVKKFDIAMKKIPDCEIEIPVHSGVAIQCALREFVDVGDHYFYICDVKNAYGDESEKALFAWNGYRKIAPLP